MSNIRDDDEINDIRPREYFNLGGLVTQDEDASEAFRKAIDDGETVQIVVRKASDGRLEVISA